MNEGQLPTVLVNHAPVSPPATFYSPTSTTPVFIGQFGGSNLSFIPFPQKYIVKHPAGSLEVLSGFDWFGVVSSLADYGYTGELSLRAGLCGAYYNNHIDPEYDATTQFAPINSVNMFAQDNKITTSADSLFDYFSGESFATFNPLVTYYPDLSFPSLDTSTDVRFSGCQPLIQDTYEIGKKCPANVAPYFYYSMCVDDVSRGRSSDLSIISYASACVAANGTRFGTPTLTSTFYNYGPGLGPYVAANIPTNFTIITTDAYGNPQDYPALNMSVPFRRVSTGTYLGYYTPSILGESKISIFSGESVVREFDTEVYTVPSVLTCKSWGDPHLSTFNRYIISLQGYSEYSFSQVGDFMVQVRQAPCFYGASATCNTAVAASYAGTTVGVYMLSSKPAIYVNKILTNTFPFTSADLSITSPHPYEILISVPYVSLSLKTYGQSIDLTLSVDANQNGPILPVLGGLCGGFNQALISGSIMQPQFYLAPDAPAPFVHDLGQTLTISATTSLFDYSLTGDRFSDHNQPSFASNYYPSFTNNTELYNQATTACFPLVPSLNTSACKVDVGAFQQLCMDDVAAGNDVRYSQGSLVAYAELCQQFSNVSFGYLVSSHTFAYGPGIQTPIAGQPMYIMIQGVDALGVNRTITDVGSLKVDIQSDKANVSVAYAPSRDGIRVEFTYPLNGTYNLVITYQDIPIFGSPYEVILGAASALSYLTGPGLTTAYAGRHTWFLINPLDASGHVPTTPVPFVVTISGDDLFTTANLPTDLTAPSYNYSFAILEPGQYHVSVTLQYGGDITGSPFYLTVQPDGSCACNPGQLCIDGICKGCEGGCNSGACVQGQCVCPGNFTGPNCQSTSLPINITFNSTSPIVIVQPIDVNNGGDSTQVGYKISITELRELDPTGAIVRSVQLGTLSFISVPTDNYTREYNASFSLVGKIPTNVFVNFSSTPFSRNFTFADQDVNLVPYSIKFSVRVDNWPFTSARSRLAVVSQSTVSLITTDTCHGPSVTPQNLNDNLVWVTSSFSGLTLYGKFLPNAIADGRLVTTTNTFNSSESEVSTLIPHFFDFAVIDPDYSVLLNPYATPDPIKDNAPPGCYPHKKNNHKTKVAVIVSVVVIVVVALAVAGAYVIYKRRIRAQTRYRIKTASSSSSLPRSPQDHGMSPLYTDDKL
eukprot:Phypoly_transcript_01123.p1 GENE.Phypoly_transcript_01123~~Phypoly_transcript_01123.p1  ORF type:complete len:1193 (+),score=170.81 Phypoly_transcript_01123:88-3579(+)